jgi:hypothetical protein
MAKANNSPDQASSGWEMPDQMVSEEEYKNPSWYLSNARFIMSNYNPVINPYAAIPEGTGVMDGIIDRWAARTDVWYSYYAGKQTNLAHSYITRDESNMPLPIQMFQDQNIPRLIKHLEGYMSDVIKNLPDAIGALGLSENITNAISIKQEIARWMIEQENAGVIAEMEAMGIKFSDQFKFNTEEELNQYFEEDHKEFEEQLYEWLAMDSLYINKWKDPFSLASRDVFVTGFGMMRVISRGGKVVYRRVPPRMAVWDNSEDSKLNLHAKYAGEIYQLTIPQIAQRYGKQLTKAELEEIQVIAKDSSQYTQLNSMLPSTNLVWWSTQNNQRLPLVTCADVEWVSMKVIGKEGDENKYITTVRKCTVIGNKFVVDWGEAENIVENKDNPSDPELSFKVCTPDIILGYPVGVTERLYKMADIMSAYRTKMIQLIARSKGRVFIIYADQLPEGMRTPQILSDFSRLGIAVINRADGETIEKDGRVGENVDLTMDPTVLGMVNLIAEMKMTMEEIVNLPSNVLGQQKGFESFKTKEFNRSQSTQGILSYYEAIEDWFLNIIDYGTETSKIMISRNEFFDGSLVIGDRGVKYLQSVPTKDFSFSKLRIYGTFDDIMRAKDRDQLMYLAELAINAQQIDFVDIVKTSGMRSARAIRNYLTAKLNERKREMAEQQAMQMQQQQEQAQLQAQTQAVVADTQAETAIETAAMKEEGATERTLIQEEGKLINK